MSRRARGARGNRGKRYDTEPKLNMKKVFAVIIAIVVIIMFIFVIRGIIINAGNSDNISSLSYFVSFQDNKWGVIDSNGNDIIVPSYQEMMIIPNEKKDVFLCTYDVNYETGEYKTKVLNKENKEIFTDYEQVEAIQNMDSNNQLWYEENVLRIKKDGKYGIMNLDGKVVVEPQYDEIVAVSGIKNAYKVKKDNLYGIVDVAGTQILNVNYSDITNLGKDNKSGYIVKDQNGKFGIVDYSANQVLECKYDSIEKVYGNDLYVVTENGAKKLVDKSGSDIFTTGFDDITSILKNKDNGVIFKLNQKYGVMNLSGTVVISPDYDDLTEAKTGILIAKKEGKYGVIDISNAEKIPFNYQKITYNEGADIYIADDENFNTTIYNNNYEAKVTGILTDIDTEKGYITIVVGDQTRYYNFRFEEKTDKEVLTTNTLYLSKKDDKYGFVDKDGNVVVDYIYDDATEQNEYGYAGIKKDGKWGSIDSKGAVVQEPIYNLDDYLLVDFIGRWHLAKDLNSNYYNKD